MLLCWLFFLPLFFHSILLKKSGEKKPFIRFLPSGFSPIFFLPSSLPSYLPTLYLPTFLSSFSSFQPCFLFTVIVQFLDDRADVKDASAPEEEVEDVDDLVSHSNNLNEPVPCYVCSYTEFLYKKCSNVYCSPLITARNDGISQPRAVFKPCSKELVFKDLLGIDIRFFHFNEKIKIAFHSCLVLLTSLTFKLEQLHKQLPCIY